MNKIYENQNEHNLKNETEKIEISEKNKKLGEKWKRVIKKVVLLTGQSQI